jgi:hypothetical protein
MAMLTFTQDEIDTLKELIPRARTFDSPAAVKWMYQEFREKNILQ